MRRYHRQILLPQIGTSGQERLLRAKVLIVGAGGLGHPVAQYLVAMGVGQIKVVDGDRVHVTNLHRQILFSDSDIGENKAQVLAKRLTAMNPDVQISFENQFLTRELALGLFNDFDVIIDCTDNFETKFLINDVCALYDKPMVYGAVLQFEAQIGVFWKSKGACYRCLYRDIPQSKIQNCAQGGVVGPVVGMVGSLQAHETMRILIGTGLEPNPMIGALNFYDLYSHSFRHLHVAQRQDCPCHQSDYSAGQILEVQRGDCQASHGHIVLDVREDSEWAEFHISGSVHFALSRLEAGERPPFGLDQELVLVCRSGARAQRAQQIFRQLHFKNVQCATKGVYEY